MAQVYNLEPQPTAKVILNTTAGDIALELFAKQTPLASRNFLQHCLDGYYTNTIFHRLVPGFIIQGGDPTGLGTGGESAFDNGKPFADEFHNRLRFNRRGLLGMANGGARDDNGSQFFLTLGETPELQGKHTMFGRVEGDTIYNLMKMGEADLAEEGGDRPLYPTRITGAEVVVNPFEDVVKRVRVATRAPKEEPRKEKAKKRKVGKTLLSFGDEEGADAVETVVKKKAKVNTDLISAGVEQPEKMNNTNMPKAPERTTRRKASPSRSLSPKPAAKEAPTEPARSAKQASPSPPPEPPQVTSTMSALEKTNAQIAALKESMKRTTGPSRQEREKPKSALEQMIPATATRGRKRGKQADDRAGLDMFNAFKKRLGEMKQTEEPASATTATATNGTANGTDAETRKPAHANGRGQGQSALDAEDALCDLHFIANCQSCRSWDADGAANGEAAADNDDDTAWLAHKLSFARDTLGKDLEWKRKMEEFEVIDPREKEKVIVGSKRKGKDGRKEGGGREWDRRDKRQARA